MRKILITALCGYAFINAASSHAQAYPNRPIRLITAEAGGGGDFVARLIAQGLTTALGQSMVVDNRAGFLSIEAVDKATPAGYTLLLYGSSMWVVPLLRSTVSWDVLKDFAPITMPAYSPNILVVHPSVPVRSVRDLITLARARPGELNYASGAVGSSNQLAAELFKSMAKLNIVQVNYKGTGPALNGVMTGQVQLLFINQASIAPQIKSGRLRAIAVTSAQPSALAPGLPTMASAGLPGYELTSKWGFFAPAHTPAAITERLNQEIVPILKRQDVKDRLFITGVETVGSSPEELTAIIKSETERLGKVVKQAGIAIE